MYKWKLKKWNGSALNRWREKGQRLNREKDPFIPVSTLIEDILRDGPLKGSHGEIVSAAKDSQP